MTAKPGRQLSPEEVGVLVDAASHAPSIHNTQPWRFAVGAHTVTLYEDATRDLPVVDPAGRQRVISCGAALLNMRLAAAHLGWRPDVELLPAGHVPRALATVSLSTRAPEARDATLYQEVFRRRTYRRAFSREPVTEESRGWLAQATREEGAVLASFGYPGAGAALLDLIVRAAEAESMDQGYRDELNAWLRSNGDFTDGIPRSALAPARPRSDGADHPLNIFPTRRQLPAPDIVETLLVLCTDGDDARAWMLAGQALQRTLLTLTRLGMAASPCNAPLHISALRSRLVSMLPAAAVPQLLLRVGYPLVDVPQTRRRPLQDVLTRDGGTSRDAVAG